MRLLKLFDFSERTFDSCLPSIGTMINIEPVPSPYTYLGENVPAFIDPDEDGYWIVEKDIRTSKITQFPFASNPERGTKTPAGILSASETSLGAGFNLMSNPPDVTGKNLEPFTNIFRTNATIFSTAPKDDLYDLTNPPYYLIGNSTPIDLTQNLVAHYRASKTVTPVTISTLSNRVSDPGAETDLTGLTGTSSGGPTDGPENSNGSPIFPAGVVGPSTYGGKGASIAFSATTSSSDVELLVAGNADDHKMESSGNDVSFSISVTFKLSTLGSTQCLVSRRRCHVSQSTLRSIEYSIHVNSTGQVVFRKGRSIPSRQAYIEITTMANVISVDTWHHVVVTYLAPESNQIYEIYVDGVSRGYTADDFGSSPSDMPTSDFARLRIGCEMVTNSGDGVGVAEALDLGIMTAPYSHPTPNSATEIKDGYVHSVAIWKDRELTSSEVLYLYNLELNGSAIGLLRHRVGEDSLGIQKASALRYGISSISPEFTSVAWNPNHYGHFRDLMESRKLTSIADGFKPVKVRFMSGSSIIYDPFSTHSQNLDTAVTSSLPFFDDGIARNRDDNPDETLLTV